MTERIRINGHGSFIGALVGTLRVREELLVQSKVNTTGILHL